MYQGTIGTLLLVQHPIRGHGACVITSMIGDLPMARIVDTAHSMETVSTYDAVIEASGVAEICRIGPGHPYVAADLKIGSRLIPFGQNVHVHDGLGIQLAIPGDTDTDMEVVEPLDFDDVDLMSRHAAYGPSARDGTLFVSLQRLGRNSCEARIFTFNGGVFDTHLDWNQPDVFWSLSSSYR